MNAFAKETGKVVVLEDCINWYYLNVKTVNMNLDGVLKDCINWYYLNGVGTMAVGGAVLEDCINWYYLNYTV